MNSDDINSIINNICEKLGTTANKLIPEMAGYNIAKSSIWLIISSIMLIATFFLVLKIRRMYKTDGDKLAIFVDRVNKLDKFYRNSDIEVWNYTAKDWERVMSTARDCVDYPSYDADSYCLYVIGAVTTGVLGAVIFGLAIQNIIGWAMSPNAMAFMWVFNQLGGVQ